MTAKSTAGRVLVVSSANMDFVMRMPFVPRAGETILSAGNYTYIPGGKGANSALAVARLGGESVFCTRLGCDANGDALRALYDDEGIDTRYLVRDAEHPTGLAVIMVEQDGGNRIVVYPGANSAVCRADIESAIACRPDALFLQFEIATQAVLDAAEIAAANGIPVFIDAGPARADFPLDRLRGVEVFSPNETEAEIFTGIAPIDDASCAAAARRLCEMVETRYIVIKLGGRGAYLWDGSRGERIPGFAVTVVDTTAAGDAFTAALTLDYLAHGDIRRAIVYANLVGALTVSRAGASTSLPTAEEVEAFSAAYEIER